MSIFGFDYLLEVDVPTEEEGEDYTVSGEDEEDATEEETNEPEQDSDDEGPDEGDDAPDDDYTLEEDESDDESDSDEGVDDEESGDEESDDEEPEEEEDESIDGEIKSMEDELMSDLSDDQKAARDKELKTLYVNLHNSISNILMKVDRVVKTADNIKTLNYCESRLGKAQAMLYDYLLDSYKTRSYIQNLTMYYQLIGTLTGIEQLLNSLTNSAKV